VSARDDMLAMMVAIGSAHAGEPLTQAQLLDRLGRDPDFRARFNGPTPPAVRFPSARIAKLAAAWQSAAVRRP
jgi:hypothetical protein